MKTWFLLALAGLLVACNPSPDIAPNDSQSQPDHPGLNQIGTGGQATLPMPEITRTFQPTETPRPTAIATLVRPSTPAPSSTQSGKCNSASAGTPFDVTYPDESGVLPGQSFIKTWRLVNTGSCKWTRLYQLVYYSGNSLGAQQEQYLKDEVLPGYAVDLSVEFTAPAALGSYQSNWMLKAADGTLFGLGMNADAPFWVRIQVLEALTETPTVTLTHTSSPSVTPTINP